jgi:hypothetical protein
MNKSIFRYLVLSIATTGAICYGLPSNAQFTSNTEGCGTVCVKLDLQSGSSNGFNNFDSFGFNNTNNGFSNNNNIRWQLGVTWRPTAPEVAQGEAERTKQRLDDNRSLMLALTEAIAQDKTDPKILLAELKEGRVPRNTFDSNNLPTEAVIEIK